MKKFLYWYLVIPFLALITGCEKDSIVEEPIVAPTIQVSMVPESGIIEKGESVKFSLIVSDNVKKITMNGEEIHLLNFQTPPITENTSYMFSVENQVGQKANCIKYISVKEQTYDPPVFLSLTAEPDTLPIGGGESVISWAFSGVVDTILLSNGEELPNSFWGRKILLTASTDVEVTLKGPGGQVSKSITITVTQPTPMEILLSSYSWRPWKRETSLNINGPYELSFFMESPCSLDDRWIFKNCPRKVEYSMGLNLCDPDFTGCVWDNWNIENENHLTMPDRYITKLDSDTLVWISVGLRMIDSLTAVQCFFRETMISEPLP